MTSPSIRVENLTRRYGKLLAINNVSFSVARGEIIGFLGPNGAGKSTTMRILSGIMSATSGGAWIEGISVAENPHAVKKKIGYMPENNPLPPDIRVAEYLRFRARLKEVPGKKVRSSVDEVMEICDLARTARRKVIGTLSKGFRQRVGIADALLGDPDVIIMDEPTIGLDPHQIQGIRKLIDGLRGRMTVILSSHILPEIERSCDRVIIINRGHIVASGTSKELRNEFLPGNHYFLEATGETETICAALAVEKVPTTLIGTESTNDPAFQRLHLKCNDDGDQGERILEALRRQSGFKVRSLARNDPSLEDIFLAATKRSWEQTVKPRTAPESQLAEPTTAP